MRRSPTNLLGLGLLLLAACDDGGAAGSAQGELQAESKSAEQSAAPAQGDANRVASDAGARREGDQGVRQLADAGPPAINLACPQGSSSGPVGVLFACDRITVVTCKDLSNVVLELADGSRQRLEGLKGHQNVFVAANGQTIVGVWVKAGDNASGDGPGYGKRFDAPSAACTDAGTTPPQDPPVSPPPGDADACVPEPDRPCFTPPGQPPSPPPSQPPTDGPVWVY
jgi:hypothetical protein